MIGIGYHAYFCLACPINLANGETSVMKRLILVLAIAMHMFFSTAALAWSPLDGIESAIDRVKHCYPDVIADEGDTASNEEEEEEPDCE